jgi:hypothetical protein
VHTAERVIYSIPLEFGKDFCNQRVRLLLVGAARVDRYIGFDVEWDSRLRITIRV